MSKYLIRVLVISVLLISSVESISARLELSDVSVLFPLPALDDWNYLISPTSSENVLPFELFQKIPFLINAPNDKTYKDLRVIGFRIDPCFASGLTPQPCTKQLRLIWQPLAVTKEGKTTTIDASLHTFYILSDEEFSDLLEFILKLKDTISDNRRFENQPLSINPILLEKGLRSDYSISLVAKLLQVISHKSIDRITFMKLKGVNDIWVFGGFDNLNGNWQEIKIPRLNGKIQQDFINGLAIRPAPKHFSGGLFPEPEGLEDNFFNRLARDSFEIDSTSENQLRQMMGEIANMENPLLNNPNSLDCVSCHLTNTIRAWSINNFQQLGLAEEYDSKKFKLNGQNLENISLNQGQTNILRMFGYFEDKPFVAQRTINETAQILNFLNSKRK